MLRFLFPRLTASPNRGAALFAWATGEARKPHWYTDGGVPDTLDGRFRMLATIIALALVRLEDQGGAGDAASVALTERFAEVMESEHRQLGLGDPKLGRTVRRLVSALSRRVDVWRAAIAGESAWADAARDSLWVNESPPQPALDHSAGALRRLWNRLQSTDVSALQEGRI